jgi:hypothetical protein
VNPPFNDPFEEERQARVGRPIEALLQILGTVAQELRDAHRAPTIRDSHALYDRALDLLVNTLNLALPVALRREANGRRAFLWVDGDPKNPDFSWLVSYPDGTWKQGTEQTQLECERVTGRLLGESE